MKAARYFRDKVVLITGSARGIGRETARLVLAAGGRVVLNGRDAEALETTRQALGFLERSLAVPADLVRPEEAEYLVATVLAAWGRLDVVINNAGLSMRGRFADLTNDTVRSMVEANFLSAVWTTRAALPALRESKGRVLFISSLAGLRGFPGVSLYSASKMALTALHQSLRAEEGPQGVSFGLAFLAFTENDASKTVLAADGQHIRHERKWAMTQVKAAQVVLNTVAAKRKRIVLTAQGRLLSWAQAWFPRLVDRVIDGSKGRIHQGEETKS